MTFLETLESFLLFLPVFNFTGMIVWNKQQGLVHHQVIFDVCGECRLDISEENNFLFINLYRPTFKLDLYTLPVINRNAVTLFSLLYCGVVPGIGNALTSRSY